MNDDLINALSLAQQEAETIGNDNSRFKALIKIANAQALYGLSVDAKKSLELAQQATMKKGGKERDYNSRCVINFVEIASLRAKIGDLDGAKKSFDLAKKISNRDDLLERIATTQAKVGYFTDAVQTAQLIESDSKKAETLCSIAKILAREEES